MKGSSLHRSGLTREKIGLLASFLHTDKKQATRSQLNNSYKAAKNHELDILWGGVQKSIQKVHSATRGSHQKSPAVYLIIGFIAGTIFTSAITFIVSISTMAPKTVANIEKAVKDDSKVDIIEANVVNDTTEQNAVSQEKYIVKRGDTLNGIAYRFYGKYSPSKIEEIKKINNITNPEAISIGQELIIPVSQDR